jgi:RNA polymerase sigma factor (sigma-70 family)
VDASLASARVEEFDYAMDEPRRQQFETLLATHQGILFKVANTYCWRVEDRADLVQEIAAQLWRAWPRYDPARLFTTWMYRIALNVAISFVRQEVRRRQVSIPFDETLHDKVGTSVFDPEAGDRLQRLQSFIGRQAPLDRALLLLYLEEKSQSEISEILGITPTNVSTKINRLKERMRKESSAGQAFLGKDTSWNWKN